MIKCENGVYVEMTPEEKEEYNKLPPIQPKSSLEEQILALQNALISQKISGGGITTVTDSSDNRIKDFKLFGKSEQVTTTGVNLIPFPYTDKDMSKNGVTFEVQQDGGVNIYGTATESVDFFLSMLDYGNDSIFNNGKGNGKILSGGKNGVEIEYHGTNKRLYLTIAKGKTVNTVIYPQLQNGSTATPYEPYTGGKPSPSPECPQEIKSVGKWNEEKQKYEVDVRVTGNNILNMQIEPDTKGTYQGWKVGDGKKKITLSIIDKGNNTDISDCYLGLTGNGYNSEDGVAWCIENGRIYKPKMTSLNPYVTIFPADETTLRKILKRFDVQCEFGEIQTEYQPYTEQTLTITSDRPITKWDKLIEQDGQIGWLYQSAIDEYSGETNVLPYKTGFGFYFLLENKNIESGEGYCEELQQCTSEKVPCIHFNLAKNTYVYTLNTETIYGSTVSDIKNYLKTHPLHIVYKTETTEFIPLPKEEQDAIRALKTYYPTTVITTNGGAVNPNVEVTYIADTKNYIDQKIAAIGKTVVETQKALL